MAGNVTGGPGTPYAGPRRRRPTRCRRKVLISIAVVIALAVSGIGITYAVLAGKIHTFGSGGLDPNRPTNNKAMDILVIGTDARGGENSKLGGSGDLVGRSDTAIVIHVYPGGKSAVAVSIPRDSLVTIPRCKLPDGSWTKPQPNTMFNAAFSVGATRAGNPTCTINTVEKLTGLRIDHTLVISFAGFAKMSKAVGGVPVCLPQNVYEGDLDPNLHYQGKLIFKAGRQLVSGDKALQYVRVRHGLGDGSDIGRIQRQQAFMASLVTTIKKKGLQPDHILSLVNAATAAITFDSSLSSPRSLLSFANQLKTLDTKNIDFVTVPWRYDGNRVAIVQPDANQLFKALRQNRPLVEPKTKGTTKGAKKHVKKLPKSVTAHIRKATANACSDLTYG